MNKCNEIKDMISDFHPICFALKETHLKKNDRASIRVYSSFRKDSSSYTRETGSVVSNDFPHVHIPLNTDI